MKLHEATAVGQQQATAFTAHRFGNEKGFGVRVVQAGRVELHKFQIGHPAAGAPRHCNAVAGRGVGIGCVEIDLTGAAGGEHGMAGGEGLNLAGVPVQRIGAVDLPFLAAGALARYEVDGDVLLERIDVGVGANPVQQAGLHRVAGGVVCVHDPASGVSALTGEVQAARHLRVGGEGDTIGGQPGDHLARLTGHQSGNRLVAQTGAGDQGVVDVRLDRVATVDRRGNSALCPVAGAVDHLTLGHNGDAALVGKLERGCQGGEAATEDEDIVSVHGGRRMIAGLPSPNNPVWE